MVGAAEVESIQGIGVMTTSFTEFLRQEAEKHQAEVIAGEATVAEWREAVQHLFAQMRAWLKASDPDGIIRVKESNREINEPGLGRYEVPSLELRVFGNLSFASSYVDIGN